MKMQYFYIMKTIAVTIDETTLLALDRLISRRSKKGGEKRKRNRSEVVRCALQELIAREEQSERDEAEWHIWSQHLPRLNRQAAALVAEQAEP